MKAEAGDLVLVLRPARSPVPVAVRLRALLKYALRAAELRAVTVREAQVEASADEVAVTPDEGGQAK